MVARQPASLSGSHGVEGSSLLEEVFAAHRGELLAFAERRMGSRATAEDLVQQAALKAVAQAGMLRDPKAGRAWLFKILRRLVVDHFRERSSAPLAHEAPAKADGEEFGCACVLANLQRIRPDFAYLLRRVVFEHAPLVDVASDLGLSANAVSVRLSRARTALREQLRAHCGTQSLRGCLDCECAERGCCTANHHPA